MHVDATVLSEIQAALQCRVEGFPQTYLGLPLSAEKLRLAAFTPLIAKVDKYLSGWRALLLSSGGRLVLLNAVLDALPVFAMGALLLPPGVIAALDKLRCAFLWAAADRVSGAQCLVAWEFVCRAKEDGGLGVRSIADQNKCLQVKLLHRLHSVIDESWPRWVWTSLDGAPIDSAGASAALCGTHWAVSTVCLGDGRRSAFWLDSWCPLGSLASAMPELHSHCTDSSATAASSAAPLDSFLVPRLSATAQRQRSKLVATLPRLELVATPDMRVLPLCATPNGKLSTSALYKLCTFGGVRSPHYEFVWCSRAPSKVKFFAWLLVQGRIQCRSNLPKKKILTEDESGCPICDEKVETPDHVVFGCPFARRFWASLGVSGAAVACASDASSCPLPPSAPPKSAATLRLLCLWHLWKHRNGVVFDKLVPSIALIKKKCRDDALHTIVSTSPTKYMLPPRI